MRLFIFEYKLFFFASGGDALSIEAALSSKNDGIFTGLEPMIVDEPVSDIEGAAFLHLSGLEPMRSDLLLSDVEGVAFCHSLFLGLSYIVISSCY